MPNLQRWPILSLRPSLNKLPLPHFQSLRSLSSNLKTRPPPWSLQYRSTLLLLVRSSLLQTRFNNFKSITLGFGEYLKPPYKNYTWMYFNFEWVKERVCVRWVEGIWIDSCLCHCESKTQRIRWSFLQVRYWRLFRWFHSKSHWMLVY